MSCEHASGFDQLVAHFTDRAVVTGDHGGFAANEWSPDNDPAAFAATLRQVLDG